MRKVTGGFVFDWIMTACLAWFTFGLFLDGWAHTHLPELETFFTSWHGILYSGFLLTAGFLYATMIRNLLKGYHWLRAVPSGYELSLLGATIFILGGSGDILWHMAFGVENGVEALYSPTHLLLALGGGLMASGPLRANWHRAGADVRDRARWLPTVLSLTFILSLLTFFTVISHPLANLWAAGDAPADPNIHQEMGVNSFILTAGILTGTVLLGLRRWALRPGTLTIIFSLNSAMMGFLFDGGTYPLIPVVAMAAAGVVADLMLYVLNPSPQRQGPLRVFASLMPGVWAAFYFVAIQVSDGIWWSVHLWAGTIFLCAIVGWLLSYLLAPPRIY